MSEYRVRDLMTATPITVDPDDDVATARNLMYRHWVRHLPVVDTAGALVGLISHRDLLRKHLIEREDVPALVEDETLSAMPVREAMRSLVETASPDAELAEAARRMLDNKYGCLPVVEGGKLVGILTESDFVRAFVPG